MGYIHGSGGTEALRRYHTYFLCSRVCRSGFVEMHVDNLLYKMFAFLGVPETRFTSCGFQDG